MEYTNGIIEDLGAALGTEAALRLIALYGGTNIYVPQDATTHHRLLLCLGPIPYKHLVAEWGGQTLKLPSGEEVFDRYRRIRAASLLISRGFKTWEIAQILGIKDRQVKNYRAQAEEVGILPMVFSRKADDSQFSMDL